MKQVFTNSSVIPCDLIKSVLEAEGISATIKNELGSAAAGYSLPTLDNPSLPWAWPEVWVADEDYERAMELINGVERREDKQEGDNPTNRSGEV